MSISQTLRGRLMRRRDAAKYLQEKWGMRCSEQTLAKYAVQGVGPTFRKYGRDVVYSDLEDLDPWAERRLSGPVRSTSDHGEASASVAA